MMVYQEKIAPPLAALTHDEQRKLQMEIAASENRWVQEFINRLAGVIRDIKHRPRQTIFAITRRDRS